MYKKAIYGLFVLILTVSFNIMSSEAQEGFPDYPNIEYYPTNGDELEEVALACQLMKNDLARAKFLHVVLTALKNDNRQLEEHPANSMLFNLITKQSEELIARTGAGGGLTGAIPAIEKAIREQCEN